MITPVKKAPKAFADRFNRIYDGEEVIDTVAKLKEFWLFAIEQGQGHREMREYISLLTSDLELTDELHAFVRDYIRQKHELRNIIFDFGTFIAYTESPYPDEQTDEEYLDMLWQMKREWAESVDAPALDKKLHAFRRPTTKL